MTEAFEKWILEKFDVSQRGGDGFREEGARWAAKAILTTPGLLWEQGKPWMGDDQIEYNAEQMGYYQSDKEQFTATPWFLFNASVESQKYIRDHAQVIIDAKDAELTRLRGELEAMTMHKERILAELMGKNDSLRSELDKAKERVREWEEWAAENMNSK